MVCGGGLVEANKRVSEIQWAWAVSQINTVVNQALTRIEADEWGSVEEKRTKLNEIEKAWQRILQG
jgi:hypothetical protein